MVKIKIWTALSRERILLKPVFLSDFHLILQFSRQRHEYSSDMPKYLEVERAYEIEIPAIVVPLLRILFSDLHCE